MTRGFLLFATTIALALPAAAGSGADDAWEKLKSLAGTWEGSYESTKSTLTYTVVSGGSAIIESMKMPAPEPDMVTVYHRDGTSLVATHYCSMGNQPRMRAAEADAGAKTIRFRFADITNLAKPDGGHIKHLTVTFDDNDHLTQDWTAVMDGKDHSSVFKWTRKK